MFKHNITEIIKIINQGGIILMQVDTVFGLICRSDIEPAISRIEQIKHRDHPSFGLFVRNFEIANKYAIFNDQQKQLFEKLFPGFFTLIVEANDYAKTIIPSRVFGKNNNKTTIGLRVPNNEFCLKVLDFFNIPLIATSANISKQPTATSFDEIDHTIISSVDAIYVNPNSTIAGLSSTILDITNIDDVQILRQGSGKYIL